MILIIDNYDSFTYNLVHLIAEQTSDYKVVRNDQITLEEIEKLNPSKILISPGPGRPSDAGLTNQIIKTFGPKTPILGVCLGHQAIGEVFGAQVDYAPSLMHGKTSTVKHDGEGVFKGVDQDFTATRYHSLVLKTGTVPSCLTITSESADGVIMGVRHNEFPIEGIQFHPESILTTEGPKMIKNWLNS